MPLSLSALPRQLPLLLGPPNTPHLHLASCADQPSSSVKAHARGEHDEGGLGGVGVVPLAEVRGLGRVVLEDHERVEARLEVDHGHVGLGLGPTTSMTAPTSGPCSASSPQMDTENSWRLPELLLMHASTERTFMSPVLPVTTRHSEKASTTARNE